MVIVALTVWSHSQSVIHHNGFWLFLTFLLLHPAWSLEEDVKWWPKLIDIPGCDKFEPQRASKQDHRQCYWNHGISSYDHSYPIW